MCLILSPTGFAVLWPLDLENQLVILSFVQRKLDVLVSVEEDPGELVSPRRFLVVIGDTDYILRDILQDDLSSQVKCNQEVLTSEPGSPRIEQDITCFEIGSKHEAFLAAFGQRSIVFAIHAVQVQG